jgi:hypothetical protein
LLRVTPRNYVARDYVETASHSKAITRHGDEENNHPAVGTDSAHPLVVKTHEKGARPVVRQLDPVAIRPARLKRSGQAKWYGLERERPENVATAVEV